MESDLKTTSIEHETDLIKISDIVVYMSLYSPIKETFTSESTLEFLHKSHSSSNLSEAATLSETLQKRICQNHCVQDSNLYHYRAKFSSLQSTFRQILINYSQCTQKISEKCFYETTKLLIRQNECRQSFSKICGMELPSRFGKFLFQTQALYDQLILYRTQGRYNEAQKAFKQAHDIEERELTASERSLQPEPVLKYCSMIQKNKRQIAQLQQYYDKELSLLLNPIEEETSKLLEELRDFELKTRNIQEDDSNSSSQQKKSLLLEGIVKKPSLPIIKKPSFQKRISHSSLHRSLPHSNNYSFSRNILKSI